MAEGMTISLLKPAIAVFLVCVMLASRVFPLPIAIALSLLRIAVPLVYFSWFFDGSWVLSDDLFYLTEARRLLEAGYNPVSILLDPSGLTLLFSVARSQHVLYPWWNMASLYLFGDNYFAAIFPNVGLTFVAGLFLYKLLGVLGFRNLYRLLFLVFFLLHWDTIAWSSFINLKEQLVATLTIASLYFALQTFRKITLTSLAGLALSAFLLLFIRFYIPLFLLGAFLVWAVLSNFKKYAKVVVIVVPVLLGLASSNLIKTGALALLSPSLLAAGTFRFILTPQPWSIEPTYSFLTLPSFLHWLLIIPAVISGGYLWRRNENARLILLFAAMLVMFYAIVPEFQGPRHRSQLAFVIAWLQFHFFWLATPSSGPPPLAGPSGKINFAGQGVET